MRDVLTLVHCRALGPFKQTVFVAAFGHSAVFTLGEVLIVLGPQTVIDLCLRGEAAVAITKPIAWPLRLKRPLPGVAGLSLSLIQFPLAATAANAPA